MGEFLMRTATVVTFVLGFVLCSVLMGLLIYGAATMVRRDRREG